MNDALATLAKLTIRTPRRLGEIWTGAPSELACIIITGVQQDSRLLQQGEAWLCLPSVADNKKKYMRMAVAAGASLCLCVGDSNDAKTSVMPTLYLANIAAASHWLRHWFGTQNPTTKIVGVTGTDGKTSVTWMLRQALEKKLGHCWSVGTLGWMRQRNDCISLGNTTPSLLTNHQILAAAHDADIPCMVMEVSSHGIHQQRIAGMPFTAAIWTTMGRDHLDYHPSIAHYQACKADFVAKIRMIVANADQPDIVAWRKDHPTYWYTHGATARKMNAMYWQMVDAGTLELCIDKKTTTITPVPDGSIHGQNLAAVATFLYHYDGDTLPSIADYLSGIDAPPGRMESVADAFGRRVLVDYAHTPEALLACLTAAKEYSPKRLLLVFGCGGERDQGKRPLMGQVAMQYADVVWVTSDNPRGEDADAIIAGILPENKKAGAVVYVVRERGTAIALAVAMMTVDDVLVIAGKGHENYMEYAGGERHPWSDIAVAGEVLKAVPLC